MKAAASHPLPFDLAQVAEDDLQRFLSISVRPRLIATTRILNPYSDVYRLVFSTPTGRACAYLKTPHHTPENEAALKRRLATEYRVMDTLAKRWETCDGFGVVEPIAFYPDIPALLTKEALGRPLRERYRTTARRLGRGSSQRELIECVRRCGEWLNEFQQETREGIAPFDVKELLDYCEIRFRLLLQDASSGFSPELAKRITSRVNETALRELANGVVITGRHNDFASHNIISQDGTIRVIDFSMYDTGAAAYDICNFWLELEMLKYDWTYSRPFLSQLQCEFLAGIEEIRPPAPAFRLARVRYSLNRLLTALGNRGVWRPDARYRRRAAEVSLDWLRSFADGKTGQMAT